MKNFDRGSKRNFNGGGGYEKRDFSGSRGFSERKEMFPAVCSDCGNRCEVPFRPSGSKPVFCNDCFRGHEAPSPRGGGRDRGFNDRAEKTSFVPVIKDNIEERLTAIHNKLDKIMVMLGENSYVDKIVKDEKTKHQTKTELDKKVKSKLVLSEKSESSKAVKKVVAPKKKIKVSAKKVVKK